MLDDARELYRERVRSHGRVRADVRGTWDVLTLALRPGTTASAESAHLRRVLDDGRHAWRAMVRRPSVSFTVVAIVTVGIALALLAFAIIEGVLLRPLPYARSHELLSVFTEFKPESGYPRHLRHSLHPLAPSAPHCTLL
jgi:hypothetical protein